MGTPMLILLAVLFGLMSLTAFVASVGVHVASFVPGAPVSVDRGVILHVAAMALCFVMIGHAAAAASRAKARGYDPKQFEEELPGLVPTAVRAVVVVLFVYALVNFAVFMARNEGKPRIENGEHVLKYKSHFVRTLTAEEYELQRRWEVRGPSGHWMFFTLIPTVYFLVVFPRARAVVLAAPETHPPSPNGTTVPSL
jgi:hypothetical protein